MKPATVAASILLGLVSLVHLLRVIFRVRVTVADADVPQWVSGVAILVTGGLAVMLWRSGRS